MVCNLTCHIVVIPSNDIGDQLFKSYVGLMMMFWDTYIYMGIKAYYEMAKRFPHSSLFWHNNCIYKCMYR